MPKSFTEKEKTYIRDRLIREAEACLAMYGVRKTTVDELVHRAGIPKGTFYLFYESKEALIFDVILKLNTEVQQQLLQTIAVMGAKPSVEQLTDIILGFYQSLDGSFLLKLIENGELEFLLQKAPPEVAHINAMEDDAMAARLMALFPEANAQQAELISAAMRGAFLMMLHKKEIAYEPFSDVLRLMIRGIILQMFGGQP